ncbi:Uncharacterised protein [Mycobacteroides abscessus subsp. abscessus]|nr:Uncharacterised protein [Mycobacteroides abscessus subsp. abscessus]
MPNPNEGGSILDSRFFSLDIIVANRIRNVLTSGSTGTLTAPIFCRRCRSM